MMHDPTPRLSVVIPHFEDPENLDACLTLLSVQTADSSTFEIIVADNMSPMGLDAVRRCVAGRARVILAEEKGAGPARNAGARAAHGDVLAFTDSDCRPCADWVQRALEAASRGPVTGGRVDVLVEDVAHVRPVEAFEQVFAFDNRTYVERKGFSVTANLVVRRDVFQTVGPFRDGVSEDVEWCHRAAGVGFPVAYADDLAVGHPARPDWPALVKKWDRLNREGYLLICERPGGRMVFGLRAVLVLLSPLGHVLTVLRSPRLKTARDRLNAAGVLFRIRLHRFGGACRLVLVDPRRG